MAVCTHIFKSDDGSIIVVNNHRNPMNAACEIIAKTSDLMSKASDLPVAKKQEVTFTVESFS